MSPRNEPKFAQINLGISEKSIGQEIKDVLDLINLPIYVRIGIFFYRIKILIFSRFLGCYVESEQTRAFSVKSKLEYKLEYSDTIIWSSSN